MGNSTAKDQGCRRGLREAGVHGFGKGVLTDQLCVLELGVCLIEVAEGGVLSSGKGK